MKVDGKFSDGRTESWTWSDTPFKIKWTYVRLVMLAEIARFVCRVLRLPLMTEYKLANGSVWNRTK